ncbi:MULTISPECIES: mechanosensitive ion channel domain-containing protein [unclassified Lysobacter]|uniref:mechanosensitive ion channel family protein n=1 Tax=unclassified Lysobacter TaxID=2635362 RepID=UPI001BE7DF87|nr:MULTISPECIES: mechanosensitive ion channel domain-containing protein [unclassified Lysobacter]MBT2746712.1 mechanosensitive ion channel [Lysobacter sp. ISL-42]MBT2751761.1 mechanosensitive ion channel [Lysobacter sp. ISL-50]MBT2778113.1 mechanosensitive ion channel [Lysobacter sp. ISL-54]MBT2781754.1 mechanosensitive ion channel [Lysobacter sp. ISL-52]
MAKQDAAQAVVPKSLLGLEAGFDIDKLTVWGQTAGLKLLSALAILLIGLWLAKWLSRALERVMTRANMEVTLRGFLRNIAYAAMVVIVAVAAVQALGVPMTSVLAVLGAAGLAIGLALKDSLSNIASGVMLIVLRPFRAGDTVQAAGVEGTVEQVRVFQTRLRTIDNRVIVLPNSLITTAAIINFTANPKRRIDLTVGVGYDDDLKTAKETLLVLAKAHANVLADPAPEVLVTALAESSVNLELRAWVKTANLVRTRSDLVEGIRNELIGKGLNIPYPQRDLHVYHHDADGRPIAELLTKAVADDGDVPAPVAKPKA